MVISLLLLSSITNLNSSLIIRKEKRRPGWFVIRAILGFVEYLIFIEAESRAINTNIAKQVVLKRS